MNKKAGILLCVVVSAVILVGCAKEEATPLSDQPTSIAKSNQGIKEKGSSVNQKITDQKVLDDLAQFIDSFAWLPTFTHITDIDKAWIVRKYHTQVGFYDSRLYEKFNNDIFSKLSDIEKLAKQNINPNITMSEDDDFSSCDGTTRDNPLWIREEQVFGWFPSGGYSFLDKTYLLEAYKKDGYYHIKAIDLQLSFDEEYYEDTSPQGTVYAFTGSGSSNETVKVGTFTFNQDTNSARYNFTKELSSLKQYWYKVEPNSSAGYQLTGKEIVNDTN